MGAQSSMVFRAQPELTPQTQAPDSNSIWETPSWNHTCQQRRILSDGSMSNPIFNFKMKTAYSRKLNELQRLTSSSGEGQSEGLIGGEALCVQMESHMMESVWERGKRGGERASKYGCLKGIYFTRLRYYRSLQRNCGWPHFIHNLIFF